MPSLTAPGPTPADIAMFEAATLRVPDHMSLTPFRVLHFHGDNRHQLGSIFLAAAQAEAMGDVAEKRAAELPLRAPSVFVVVTDYKSEEKVPRQEQFASAACAAYAIVQTAFVQELGAIWRTGPYAESSTVKNALQIGDNDIVGFIYVGTPTTTTPIKPAKTISVFSEPSL